MYIKRVTIQGFKTYKNTTLIDNFSPHHNVVIGSNGSGKSNFFAAIRFVLSDDYNNLKREERQGLIHQGSGSVMSAYVEIVFDNSDGRLLNAAASPSNPDEVVIRRTIGLKKDEYSLNSKSCSKIEIKNLLESAGFSTANPYYIVPQGRIVALTNAKDYERLQLLKEVTGANSFEKKLRDSLNKMDATNRNRKKIDSELRELDEKLQELNEEREELEKYNALERDRKVFQFTLYDRELNDVTNHIEKLDSEYNNTVDSSEQYVQELDKREVLIGNVTKNLVNIDAELKIKKSTDLEQSKANQLDVEEKKADLDVKCEELQRQIRSTSEQAKTDESNLASVLDDISRKETQIKRISPRFEELTREEHQFKTDLDLLQQKQRDLLAKRGRYAQFKTQEERNGWIQSEIADLKEEAQILESTYQELSQERSDLQEQLAELDEQTKELNDSIQGPGITAELEDLNSEISQLKQLYITKIDERKELWRSEQKLQTISETLMDDVKRSERSVNETMDRSLANGLKAVREISERLKLPENAVYGPLGELIKVNEKYKTCAETVGGNSLFHVVVDTEDTAGLLMQELYNVKGGRVTFMPLNRLHADNNVTYPSNEQSSCTALIKKIKYDEKFERAVKHVFGKTIVVRDLTLGTKLARQYKLNAITLDGDRADKRGVLTGGYHDHHKKTRLDSLKDLKHAKTEYSTVSQKLNSLKKQLHVVDDEVDQLNNKIKQAITKKESIMVDIEGLRSRLNNRKNEIYLREDSMNSILVKLEKCKTSQRVLEDKIKMYEQDFSKPFDTELSDDEKETLKSISIKAPEVQKNLNVTTEALNDIATKIDSLRAELELKLKPQRKELEIKLAERNDSQLNVLNEELTDIRKEQEHMAIKASEAQESLDSLKKAIKELETEKSNNEKVLEKANSQQRLLLKKLERFQKDAERSMIKKTTLAARRDELQQKLREIGLLAEDSLNKYNDLNSDELFQRLSSVNEQMSQMSNVNKRALENCKKFNEKKKELENRAQELTESKKSIEDLISSLKQQKVDAVEATFQKVAKNFSEVFEKLVPRGAGKLVIHHRSEESKGKPQARKKRRNDEDEGAVEDGTSDEDIVYTGVSISVSFNSKQDEQLHVEQLSGGQKTVCAIALILAIQKVDPAPFYLFDEIDAALDKQYRTSVANTIKELSANAQFICTTFRSDMLRVADVFYRVKYENKISTVAEVSQRDAINFIKGGSGVKMSEI